MPQLKVCGITDAAFAVEAARRGVDYLGLIFAEGSPRHVTVGQACEVVAAVRGGGTPVVPVGLRFVGVFVDHDVEEIGMIASSVGLDVIQLHGDYGAEAVAGRPPYRGEGRNLLRPKRTPCCLTGAGERNAAGRACARTGR